MSLFSLFLLFQYVECTQTTELGEQKSLFPSVQPPPIFNFIFCQNATRKMREREYLTVVCWTQTDPRRKNIYHLVILCVCVLVDTGKICRAIDKIVNRVETLICLVYLNNCLGPCQSKLREVRTLFHFIKFNQNYEYKKYFLQNTTPIDLVTSFKNVCKLFRSVHHINKLTSVCSFSGLALKANCSSMNPFFHSKTTPHTQEAK